MKKIPKIEVPQVVVLRVDKNTGIVLDDQFNPDISIDQKRFTIFNNLNAALKYIEQTKGEKPSIEFIVYDNDEKIITRINA